MLRYDRVLLCMCRGPFRKPNGWLTWGLLGVVLSPVVIGLTVTALTSAGYEVSLPLLECSCDEVLRQPVEGIQSTQRMCITAVVVRCLLQREVPEDPALYGTSKYIASPKRLIEEGWCCI